MIRVYPIAGAFGVVTHDICAGYGMRNGKLHDACDLCAPRGSALVAVDDGEVHYGTDPMGGNVAVLHAQDGVAYYYAHMLDAQSGTRSVKTGEQIGRVGMSGNAQGTVYHCHFQVWPTGSFDQGSAHPDPTQALLAAPILDSPVGSRWYSHISSQEWLLIAAAAAGVVGAVYVGMREGAIPKPRFLVAGEGEEPLSDAELEEVAEWVDMSARYNANDTGHEEGFGRDSEEWEEVYRGTLDMLIDGLTADEWRGHAPRQLTHAEAMTVKRRVLAQHYGDR